MNLSQLIKEVSDRTNGTHTAYDENRSFVVIPVPSQRYQSVLAEYVTYDNIRYIEASTKICDEAQTPDKLFKIEKKLTFAKLAIKNGFLQVISYLDPAMSPDLAAAIIKEMAVFADEQEMAITGQDVY